MKRIVLARGVYGLKKLSSDGIGMLLNGQMIESIIRPPFPQGILTLDTENCMISPLFVDYHLHFFRKDIEDCGLIARALQRDGIGTIYEGGDRQMNGLEMKKRLKGRIDVRCAGSAIFSRRGYGANLGVDVQTVEDAKLMIDRLVSRQVDYSKIINSGIFLPETGKISQGGWDAGSLAEIASCAKQRGLEVFCHANGEEAVRNAVHAGAGMIIHGFFASRDTLFLMRDRNVALVPTIAALSGLGRTNPGPSGQARLRDMVDRHLETVADAASIGVRVLPGSDAGASFLPYGETFAEELRFLGRTGMSEERIVNAASGTLLGPGMRADFLALDGLRVKKVFLKGECVIERNE